MLGYVFRAVVVLWGVTLSLAAIFVPKVYMVLTDDGKGGGSRQVTRYPSQAYTRSDHVPVVFVVHF